MKKRAFIGLGGNLGDVLGTFRGALVELAKLGKLGGVSRAYRTTALVPPGAPAGPDYWNAVVGLETLSSPEELLRQLLVIERRFGRERRDKWGPRTLDLDLLVVGAVTHTSGDLILPHPRMHERVFVLAPLEELAPELVVPGMERTVSELLAGLSSAGVKEIRADW